MLFISSLLKVQVEPVFRMWICIVNMVTKTRRITLNVVWFIVLEEMFSCAVYGFVYLHTLMMQ
jgi:hypothetical protein